MPVRTFCVLYSVVQQGAPELSDTQKLALQALKQNGMSEDAAMEKVLAMAPPPAMTVPSPKLKKQKRSKRQDTKLEAPVVEEAPRLKQRFDDAWGFHVVCTAAAAAAVAAATGDGGVHALNDSETGSRAVTFFQSAGGTMFTSFPSLPVSIAVNHRHYLQTYICRICELLAHKSYNYESCLHVVSVQLG